MLFGTISRGLHPTLVILCGLVAGCHLNEWDTAVNSSIQVTAVMCSKPEYDYVLKSSGKGGLEEALLRLQKGEKGGDRSLGTYAFDIKGKGVVEARRSVKVSGETNRTEWCTIGTRVEVEVTNGVMRVNLEMSDLPTWNGAYDNHDRTIRISAETSMVQGKRIIGNSSPNFLGTNLVFVVVGLSDYSK